MVVFFCPKNESVDHLFLHCSVARFPWRVVGCAFGINGMPTSMKSICDWVFEFPVAVRKLIAVGVAALCWAVWKARTEACFQCVFPKDHTNLLLLICYWIKYRASLQKHNMKEKFYLGAEMLQLIAASRGVAQKTWLGVVQQAAGTWLMQTVNLSFLFPVVLRTICSHLVGDGGNFRFCMLFLLFWGD